MESSRLPMEVRPATLIPTWQVRKLRLGHRLGCCGPRLRQGSGGPWVTGTLSMMLSSASTAGDTEQRPGCMSPSSQDLLGTTSSNHLFFPDEWDFNRPCAPRAQRHVPYCPGKGSDPFLHGVPCSTWFSSHSPAERDLRGSWSTHCLPSTLSSSGQTFTGPLH